MALGWALVSYNWFFYRGLYISFPPFKREAWKAHIWRGVVILISIFISFA